jgi:NADPH-dependent F420 reductase
MITGKDDMTERRRYKIAVLGGTGAQGSGLALRLAAAGHTVTIGSRSADKASAAAAELSAKLDGKSIVGDDNRQAAAAAEVVMLTVPYAVQKTTVDEVIDEIAGKILIDATVPLVPPKVSVVQLPDGQSAVAAIQQHLGSRTRVVSAFQNVSAQHLADLNHDIDCDVLVCGDDREARAQVIALAQHAGMRAFHAGPLANSVVAEALTSVLITINRQFKVKHSGIVITGLPAEANDA